MLVDAINTPYNEITDYTAKIVALVQEWVLSEPCTIFDYDDYYHPSDSTRPPQGQYDTPSVCSVKYDILELEKNPSQYKAYLARPGRLAKAEAVAKVYETWFYTEERSREIAAVFNLITVSYASDTSSECETKAFLRFLYSGIEGATKKRGYAWLESIREFVRYWEQQHDDY